MWLQVVVVGLAVLILVYERKIYMSTVSAAQALADLQAAQLALAATIATAITDLQALAAQLAAGAGVSPAAIEAVVANLQASNTSLGAADSAAVPPAPPAAPTS